MDDQTYVQPDSVYLGNGSFDSDQYSKFYATHSNEQPRYTEFQDETIMSQQHPTTTGEEPQTFTTTSSLGIRTSMPAVTSISPLQTTGLAFSQAYHPSAAMLTTTDLSFGLFHDQQSYNHQDSAALNSMAFNTYGIPFHQSPTDDLGVTQEQIHNNSMDSSYMPPFPMGNVQEMAYQFQDINNILTNGTFTGMTTDATFPSSFVSHSPQDNALSRSLSTNSESWSWVEMAQNRQSTGAYSEASNHGISPSMIHIRTHSSSSQDSDAPPLSAHSTSSGWVDVTGAMFPVSPEPESHDHSSCDHSHSHHSHHVMPSPSILDGHSYRTPMPLISTAPSTTAVSSPTSSGSSPVSSIAGSPKSKRRNSPISPAGVTQKTIVKKKGSVGASKENKAEKKVGKRKGPLRPEQRQQAHEIRKLRACLRCKFLKKVCDKGDPCSGCKPSHARLWQVPCTRLAIQDIAYFIKGWTADYERHITMQVSVANIKGFSPYNRDLMITHGYGYMFPVRVREVFLYDDKDLNVDWMETITGSPIPYERQTSRLSADVDGISRHHLSQYVEQHLLSFEGFVDEYFESTPFLMEMLKTIYRFYVRTQSLPIKKGLKLVIAYALTLHITLVRPGHQDDFALGMISDEKSRFYGQIASPVMINFQVKKAMADLWREYMKDVLEELSSQYSSVYSGDKLKNWPTIFMLACLILAVWEMMQFDQNYRVPDEKATEKFCEEMESVPVGVIVGLFSAISTKLPTFLEWDTRKHSHVLQDNAAVCDTMTEVRAHVEKHESYLRKRHETAVYDPQDFDSLSNKFLSKLVIRAGAS